MGHHHREVASARRGSARLLLAGDKPNLSPTWQRKDTPPRVGWSLLSKLARYSLRLAPSARSRYGGPLRARCYRCDPVRRSRRFCHQSADCKRYSIRSSAPCPRSGDQAEYDETGGNQTGDRLAQQCRRNLRTQKRKSEEPCWRSCVLISWQSLYVRIGFSPAATEATRHHALKSFSCLLCRTYRSQNGWRNLAAVPRISRGFDPTRASSLYLL